MPGIIVKPRARLFHGHEWIYAADVLKLFGEPKPGQVITLKDGKDRPLGAAIYNPKSQIVARRFSRRKQDLDVDFFRRRLERAWEYRKNLGETQGLNLNLCRVIWSEADGLPGVVIDRYGDHFVLQTLTLGMDLRKEALVEALVAVFQPKSVIERNDAPIRAAEGMEVVTGVLHGENPGAFRLDTGRGSFLVDLLGGQKTGLYLDQLDNYAAVAAFARGRRVLDAFCNQGGFALACALAGAVSVTGIDASESAVAAAKDNAAASGVADRVKFEEANVFGYLKEAERKLHAGTAPDDGEAPEAPSAGAYDLIVLDPPSFARNKGSVHDALRGYKEIHLRALKLLRPGGLLSTFSCSHHITRGEFMHTIIDASVDAKKTLRLVKTHAQRPDHPVLPAIPETEYLKGYTFEVLGAF